MLHSFPTLIISNLMLMSYTMYQKVQHSLFLESFFGRPRCSQEGSDYVIDFYLSRLGWGGSCCNLNMFIAFVRFFIGTTIDALLNYTLVGFMPNTQPIWSGYRTSEARSRARLTAVWWPWNIWPCSSTLGKYPDSDCGSRLLQSYYIQSRLV